ncbi:protein phosphatase CheZ [Deltaproteobacteria bacterium TL4]
MNQLKRTEIPKDELWNDFIRFKLWLVEYWTFLNELPLDVFSDNTQIVEYLKHQHQKLTELNLKFQTMEMVGALVKISLKRIQTETLVFELPISAYPPPEFKEIADLSGQLKNVEYSLRSLVEQVHFLSSLLPAETKDRIIPILDAIASLFKAIIRQDGDDIKFEVQQLNLLTSTRDAIYLIEEIGKMTREIYNSLQDLSADIDTAEFQQVTDEMPDAVQKLYSVIQRLEDATNDNLDFLEKLLQACEMNVKIVEGIIKGCEDVKEKMTALKKAHPELAAEIAPIQATLQLQIHVQTEALLAALHEDENSYITIMSNQGFQDLTGQTLKKIIDFMEKLELRLLELIQKYSPHFAEEQIKQKGGTQSFLTKMDQGSEGETIALHGPDETDSKKSTQNDVDSLLAELGF